MKKLQPLCLLMAALTIPILLLAIGRVNAGDRAGPRPIAPDSTTFHLLWEKEFPKEIKDVAWGETEDGRLYPKIIVFEDEVRFYNTETEVIASVIMPSMMNARTSKKGNYILVGELIKKPSKSELGKEKVKVYNDKGKLVSGMEANIGWEISPYYYVSDDGSTVEVENGHAVISFRNAIGKEMKKLDLFEDEEWCRGPLKGDFSDDGDFFAVLTNEGLFTVPSKKHPWLLLFSVGGKELWRKPLYEKRGRDLWVSPRGDFIIVALTDNSIKSNAFLLFSGSGDKIGQYLVEDGNTIWRPKCNFSPNELYISVGTGNSLYLIGAQTGEVVWYRQIPYVTGSHQKKYSCLENIFVTNEGQMIASFIEWQRHKAIKREILIIGKDGKVKQKIQSTPGKGEAAGAISKDGTEITCVSSTTLSKWRSE